MDRVVRKRKINDTTTIKRARYSNTTDSSNRTQYFSCKSSNNTPVVSSDESLSSYNNKLALLDDELVDSTINEEKPQFKQLLTNSRKVFIPKAIAMTQDFTVNYFTSPPGTGKTSFAKELQLAFENISQKVKFLDFGIKDKDIQNTMEYLEKLDVEPYDVIMVDDADILIQKLNHKQSEGLGQIETLFKSLRNKKVLMFAVTSFAFPLIKRWGLCARLLCHDEPGFSLKVFGVNSNFLKTHFDEIDWSLSVVDNYCYHIDQNDIHYYLIEPCHILIGNQRLDINVIIHEPSISTSVWSSYRTSPKLSTALDNLMRGLKYNVPEFRTDLTMLSKVFKDENAVYQMLWHYGIIRRMKQGRLYKIFLTPLLEGETLKNVMEVKLKEEILIDFNCLFSLNKWQLLIDHIFFEFNRVLTCYDAPLTEKVGVLESTITLAFNMLPGRSVKYKLHLQNVSRGGRSDYVLEPLQNDSPAIIELKVVRVHDLFRLFVKNVDDFEIRLKEFMVDKSNEAIHDIFRKDYFHTSILVNHEAYTLNAFVFCRTLCVMAVQRCRMVGGTWKKQKIQHYFPKQWTTNDVRKLHRTLTRKRQTRIRSK